MKSLKIYEYITNDDIAKFSIELNDISHKVDVIDLVFDAINEKSYKIVEYLLKKYSIANKTIFLYETPIARACLHNDYKMVELILMNKGDPNGSPLSSLNPLDISLNEDNFEVFNLLLKYNVDVNYFIPKLNRTILDSAYFLYELEGSRYYKYIELLLSNNAISSRYFNIKEKPRHLLDHIGKVLNYDFNYLDSVIKIGFLNNRINFVFSENRNIINIIFITHDWPFNNSKDYYDTDYSFFFKFLNDLNSDCVVGNINCLDVFFKYNTPVNLSKIQVLNITNFFKNPDKVVNVLIPIDQRIKKFDINNIKLNDFERCSYNWPNNKRGYPIYEDFFEHKFVVSKK